MKTIPITKENFMMEVNIVPDKTPLTFYIYIGEKIFTTKNSVYIYGVPSDLVLATQKPEAITREIKRVHEEMWKLLLVRQKENPLLTHILKIKRR